MTDRVIQNDVWAKIGMLSLPLTKSQTEARSAVCNLEIIARASFSRTTQGSLRFYLIHAWRSQA